MSPAELYENFSKRKQNRKRIDFRMEVFKKGRCNKYDLPVDFIVVV